MRIGLVGTPGSGKSELAEALASALDLRNIDGYAEDYEYESNFAVGEDATYIVNLGIAMTRLTKERAYAERGGTVTCGTMLDTAAYMSCETTLFPEDGAWRRRALASISLAGCMVSDLMTYDFVFYLPSKNADSTFLANVDEAMATALNLFEIAHITLDRPTLNENLELALRGIRAATD